MKQITNNIMMIEPVSFNYNTETAINNYYQINNTTLSKEEIQQKALKEFKEFVSLLRSKNINVIVFKDTENPKTPDSIFLTIGFLFILMEKLCYTPCMRKIED